MQETRLDRPGCLALLWVYVVGDEYRSAVFPQLIHAELVDACEVLESRQNKNFAFFI